MTQIPNLFSPFYRGGKGDFLEIRIWILPFDMAQGGELIEPFVIWCLACDELSRVEFSQSWTQQYLDIHYYCP